MIDLLLVVLKLYFQPPSARNHILGLDSGLVDFVDFC